jgi:uncharacterized protein YuzE
MRVRYDAAVDALYITLDDSRIVESDEVRPGIIVDYNSRDEVVGIEVLDVRRRISQDDLKQLRNLVT